MTVSSLKYTNYSVDQFVNVAKNNKIKKRDVIMVTAKDESNLSVPYGSIYHFGRNDMYSSYIDPELFQSVFKNRLGVTISKTLPEEARKTLHFQNITINLNQFKLVTHFDMSFEVMRNKITEVCLSNVILPDLIGIVVKYLPVQDAPDGCTAEECLEKQRKAEALEEELRNDGWLI